MNIRIINRKKIKMHKYYTDILRKNKYIPKLLNKIMQMVNKNNFVDIIGLRGNHKTIIQNQHKDILYIIFMGPIRNILLSAEIAKLWSPNN